MTLAWPKSLAVIGAALLLGLAVYIAYFTVLKIFPSSQGSLPLWLANGITTAVLLLRPYREWPIYLIAAFLGEIAYGGMAVAAVVIASANAVESVTCAFLFTYLGSGDLQLDRPQRVTRFLLAAIAGTTVATAVATWAVPLLPRVNEWFSLYFFLGDLLGLVVVTPFVLVCASWRARHLRSRRQAISFTTFTVAEVLVAAYVFGSLPPNAFAPPLPYLVVPIVVAHALAFGPGGAATAVFAVSVTGVLVTAYGAGPFAATGSSLMQQIASLQIFVGALAISVAYLGAYVAARQNDEARANALEHALVLAKSQAATARIGGMIVHDVGNLLAAVSWAVKMRQWPEELTAEFDRVNRLLRSFMRLSVGKQQRHPFVLDDCVRELSAVLTRMGYGKFAVEMDLHAARSVIGDPLQFELAVFVLAQNALDAMIDGGVLSLRTGVRGDLAEIQISDQGPGLTGDLRENLFAPFQTTKPHGNGFGLYAAKLSMEEMGGSLTLIDTGDKGTTFSICLPLFVE